MKLIFFVLFTTIGLVGHAQNAPDLEHQDSRLGLPLAINTSSSQAGFAAYVGFNAGYTSENPHLSDREMPASIKLLGSYVFLKSATVIDFGYGLQRNSFSHTTTEVTDSTRGVFETAARYQFENRWQFGGIFNQFANQGENFGATQADVQFLGFQALNEFCIGQELFGRFGARVMTSLNVKGANVNMALVDFQVGWGRKE